MDETDGKKRKRARESDISTPRKKLQREDATEDDGERVQFVPLQLPPSFPAPRIAFSPGFDIPEALTFQSSPRPRPTVPRSSLLRKNSRQAPEELVLHANDDPHMEYTAQEDKQPATSSGLKHYIGWYDAEAGTLEYLEVKKMIVRGMVKAKKAPEEAFAQRTMRANNTQLRNELSQAFGTKKAKKAIADAALNAITAQTENADAVQATMEAIGAATATMATREELAAAVDKGRPVPQANLDAENVEDVYDPIKLIGEKVFDSVTLDDWEEKLENKENITLPCEYVATRIVPAWRAPDVKVRLRVLRYTYYLIMYFALGRASKRDAKKAPPKAYLQEVTGAPDAVAYDLRQRFTEAGQMTKFHSELLLTHCAALACFLDDFKLDTRPLREGLRIDQAMMDQVFREIGATINKNKDPSTKVQSHIARLALPLAFPKSRPVKRRAR